MVHALTSWSSASTSIAKSHEQSRKSVLLVLLVDRNVGILCWPERFGLSFVRRARALRSHRQRHHCRTFSRPFLRLDLLAD